jgi:hypothetical protein
VFHLQAEQAIKARIVLVPNLMGLKMDNGTGVIFELF